MRTSFRSVPWLVVLIAACWTARVSAQDATAGYLTVQGAFLREDFPAAATLAQTFLTEHPNAPEAPRVQIWLALSLDRLQRTHEALQELDALKSRLRRNDPLWAEVFFWEGDISRRASDMMRAKLAYRQLLAQAPASSWAPQAHVGLGLVYLHQQVPETALQHFHEVAIGRPGTRLALEALLYEGLAHLHLGYYPEAFAILKPLPQQFDQPETAAEAAFYLGESLSGLEQYDEAIPAYYQALSAPPGTPWRRLAFFGMGWAHFRANRCPESVAAFDDFLAEPVLEHRSAALFAKGSCLMQIGREEQALPLFEDVFASASNQALMLESGLVLADAARRREESAQAKELLHRMLRWPLGAAERAKIQLRLASLALDQGNTAQAQTVFRLATESQEPSIRQLAYSGLGDVQMALGNPAQAQQAYEEVVRITKDSPLAGYAAYQLGRIHLQLGTVDKAVEQFRQLIGSAQGELADDARLALALAYLHQRETILARAQLDAIRNQRSKNLLAGRAAYYLALLALGEGEDARAQRLCHETIEAAPRSEEAIEARLLLADLVAEHTSIYEAAKQLQAAYESGGLPSRHRAKAAKRLGDFARTEGAYDEAIQWYDVAAEILPLLRGETAYWIASCYEEAGRFDDAIARYEMIDSAPWRVRGRLAAAKLLERQGRLQAAEVIYELLAREAIPEANIVRERLAALRAEQHAE